MVLFQELKIRKFYLNLRIPTLRVTKNMTPKSKIRAAKCTLDTQETKHFPKQRKLNYGSENVTTTMLEAEVKELKQKFRDKTHKIEELSEELKLLNKQTDKYAQQLRFFSQNKDSCTFSYASLKKNEMRFEYMTALS